MNRRLKQGLTQGWMAPSPAGMGPQGMRSALPRPRVKTIASGAVEAVVGMPMMMATGADGRDSLPHPARGGTSRRKAASHPKRKTGEPSCIAGFAIGVFMGQYWERQWILPHIAGSPATPLWP